MDEIATQITQMVDQRLASTPNDILRQVIVGVYRECETRGIRFEGLMAEARGIIAGDDFSKNKLRISIKEGIRTNIVTRTSRREWRVVRWDDSEVPNHPTHAKVGWVPVKDLPSFKTGTFAAMAAHGYAKQHDGELTSYVQGFLKEAR